MEKYLASVLEKIKINDTNYDIRYPLVFEAINLSQKLGYKTGIRIDDEWVVFQIQLPTGQVSWHMPSDGDDWDGHSTEEKYKRCDDYIKLLNK